MARPQNIELKTKIREAHASGSSIEALMADFRLSRNTIFYHLREDPTKDKREHYSQEEREKIARMSDDELTIYAQQIGKTFVALQRVAYRARKTLTDKATVAARTKIELRGWVNFGMQSELLLFGLNQDMVDLASRRLAPFRLRLTPPNRLETVDGRKYCTMKLGFQKALLADPIETVKKNAEKIKAAWRLTGCPNCGGLDFGLMMRRDQSTYRVCPCGWSEDTGKVEKRVEPRRQGYHSEVE